MGNFERRAFWYGLVRFGRFGRFGNFLTCSQLRLTNVNIGLDGLVSETFEHLSDGLPVLFGRLDAVGCHKGIDDICDDDVADVEAGELAVDERLEISLYGGDERLLPFRDQVVVLVGVHTLERRDLDGEESFGVGFGPVGGTSAEEPREDGVAVRTPLELDAAEAGIPKIVAKPLVKVFGYLYVNVILRHRKS